MDKALRGIETSNYELEFETKSKEIRYLLVNATTRRDAEYNITGVVGVAQDVTESTKNDRAMTVVSLVGKLFFIQRTALAEFSHFLVKLAIDGE
jgi:signal transduction histidine kinase